MQTSPVTLLIAATIAIYVLLDTIVILRTGHTPGLFRKRGPVTRSGRPQLFWSYVTGNVAVFIMAAGYIGFAVFAR
jgi:hypothetical protein